MQSTPESVGGHPSQPQQVLIPGAELCWSQYPSALTDFGSEGTEKSGLSDNLWVLFPKLEPVHDCGPLCWFEMNNSWRKKLCRMLLKANQLLEQNHRMSAWKRTPLRLLVWVRIPFAIFLTNSHWASHKQDFPE